VSDGDGKDALTDEDDDNEYDSDSDQWRVGGARKRGGVG
jgi:hypothetical protein